MIAKFIKPANKKPVDYLLADCDAKGRARPSPPVILAGDADSMGLLIRFSKQKQPYTHVVLSFEEKFDGAQIF